MNRIVATISTFFVTLLVAGVAFAQSGEAASSNGLIALAAAIAISVAAVGGAAGQGRAAAAALEGIGRNPQSADESFVPMLLAMALMESLVIFAFIIAFLLQGKI